MHKIVARFRDGRTLKGTTVNFSPTSPSFNLAPANSPPGAQTKVVELCLLKAVFFVNDFDGNPTRDKKATFAPRQGYEGRTIKVEFADGEVMLGATPNYSPEMPGFFVFPADANANTIKVFVVTSGVKSVRLG